MPEQAAKRAARDEDAVERALAAFIRAEVEAPVERLAGLVDILADEARAAGLAEFADDLGRMQSAAARLRSLVAAVLDGAADRDEPSAIRHDLRTPIAAIIGYGELIAEEAGENVDAPPELAAVLSAAAALLKDLDRLIAFADAGGSADGLPGRSAPVPETLRQAVAVARQVARSAPTSATVRGRILVVDDNAAMRDLIERRLVRDGHEVETCADGREALDLVATGRFDLMLLDLMMPGMTGLDVLAELEKRLGANAPPVIVISAFDEVDAAVGCIDAGADDFLPKPPNETLLRARISSSLERKFLRDRERQALGRLHAEQQRSDMLLRNILPDSVVERLQGGETEIADQFDDITVLFCDLVGFTAMASAMTAAKTLAVLNDIFSGFDALVEANGLEKIKTIGDAYMAAGGLTAPREGHARRALAMAAAMPDVVARVAGSRGLRVRIGVHTGPAAAGIIGTRKFFYDIWGDTVNTASRLEASAGPGRIHVSEATAKAAGPGFAFEEREPVEIKGKGRMRSFHLRLR